MRRRAPLQGKLDRKARRKLAGFTEVPLEPAPWEPALRPRLPSRVGALPSRAGTVAVTSVRSQPFRRNCPGLLAPAHMRKHSVHLH